jgi:hypothetical protein
MIEVEVAEALAARVPLGLTLALREKLLLMDASLRSMLLTAFDQSILSGGTVGEGS